MSNALTDEWQDDKPIELPKAADLMFLADLIEPTTKFPMHNVRTRGGFGGFGQYVIQIPMSGKKRFIGYKISDPEIACRFADMASLRFRKYIRRVKWNFSEAQAIADTANTEENGGQLATFLLVRREKIWKRDGIILTEVGPVKVQTPKRRTVESRLHALEVGFLERVAALELRIAAIESFNGDLDALGARLDALTYAVEVRLVALEGFRLGPPAPVNVTGGDLSTLNVPTEAPKQSPATIWVPNRPPT